MSRLVDRLQAARWSRWLKWLLLPGAAAAVVGTVLSQSSSPPTPTIALASEPLYARGARAKPTLTLALSVEFPTVGAQYVSTPGANTDNTYSPSNEYIGYFDSGSCYRYNDQNPPSSTEVPSGGSAADAKRFDWLRLATNRTCGGDSFSGNFMNWASSSAIDILRYGLTGGDRVVDLQGLTVLQRAVLPDFFWNSSNFPDKQLSSADAPGAVPNALSGGTTGTIHVANCLNHIHFGTSTLNTSCANPGGNANLGVAGASSQMSAVSSSSSFPSSGMTPCASEGGTCSVSGANQQVWYGANNSWKYASVSNSVGCNNGVFGDPISGVVKACFYRTYSTGWTPTTSPNALTTDGFFYSRVSVCQKDSTGNLQDPRPDLCLRYPSGFYKPVGNLQKYSDRLRVAAFGYLNDSTGNPNERYGGVLRAPMKYVGPSYYDANFALVSGNNPNREWDPATGIFVANPDGNTTVPTANAIYLSGVTNYLNQFGRTGTFGQYKIYDPVGELYYESLRYLQGLPPTPQATVNMTTSMQDGFPVTTSWTDPHPAVAGMSTTDPDAYACVRNNIVAIGDVNTHNDKSYPGNLGRTSNEGSTGTVGFPSGRPANVAANEPDFYFWTKVVGGFESNTGVAYTDGKGASRTTANFNPPNTARWGMENQNIGADAASYFLAGAAYWANTHDIRGSAWTSWPSTADPRRPGMRVTTYFLDVNEFANQNDATTRHNNQFFLAAKYGGFDDVTGQGTPYKAADLSDSNDTWQDAAHPGEAKNYFLSSSAPAVLSALNNIFAKVAAQANSIAGGAVSTQRLTSVASYIYQAQFDPAAWSGDLQAFAATSTSGVATTPTWQASVELNTKAANSTPGGASRKIVIGKVTPTSTATATDFQWASVDAGVQTALRTPPYASASAPLDLAATGQARLEYLRGSRSNEAPSGLLMRKRVSVLGDIVNAAVAYSGAPSQDISDSAYATFASSHAGRRHALFVGANDGMLHAFDPDTGSGTGSGGDEIFAYIPSWMTPKLAALTSPSYVHQSYVDGSAAVAEAKVGAGMSSATWKTVLVGATGGGGQGVYALDVSDPGSFSAADVMWEFTDADDPDLGNVIGHPQILKLRSTATSATADYQYFAVFASGVNNYANDGHSSTGDPAIFLLDLSKPSGVKWTKGTNYYKVSFTSSTSMASGMAGFTARLGSAGEVAAIYAGDLQGNLWKLDFAQAINGKGDWNLAKLSSFKATSGGTVPVPLYIAQTAAGVRQPITMNPKIVYDANRRILVTFGTGKFLEVSDNVRTGAPQQSVYAILDNNSSAADTTGTVASAIRGRGRLAQGTVSGLSSGSGTIAVPAFTWGRSLADIDPANVRSGWYFDFTTSGERQISDFEVLVGRIVFGSVVPALNSCDNGSGNVYVTDLASGNSTFTQSNVGILGQPYVSQVNAATLVSADNTGQRKETSTWQIILQGSGGLAAPAPLLQTVVSYFGRLSWREISNYQQIRNNP